ncbi:MAG: transglycosylase domain-containing protein [Candidatus Shapirobacteria bacterium]
MSKINFKDKKFWYKFVIGFLILIVVGFLMTMIVFAIFSKDLPSPSKVVRRDGFSSKIYDRNGELLYDVFKNEKRIPAVWSDVPDYLKKATIAVEDKEFYKHKGFDPLAPFRIIKNVFYFHKLTGGSTLTQQLVKNVLLSSDVTVTRKIKEFILAVQIEAKYKKDDILLMYLNEAPYGGIAWGIEAGSQQYFNKPIKDLNLTESAILAGLPQRPNAYSPFSKTPMAYVDRTKHVLTRMVEDGYISQEAADQALEDAKTYVFSKNRSQIVAPHFVLWIRDVLIKKYGEEVVNNGGLKVTTTLDLRLQEEAEKIMYEEIDKAEKLGISNGASIMVDPTNGQVLSMVGSRDYFSDKTDGNFNVVTQALRQPGSAIKPITYLAAIQKGYTASSLIMDTPVTFPGGAGQKDYSPQNYTGKFVGPLSLRNALGNSINTTAVKTLARVGLKNMLTLANDMGLTTLAPTKENLARFGLAVTLGGAEVKIIDLAGAYTAFANGGNSMALNGVLKVEDSSGRVLEEFKAPEGKKVMTPQEAFIISNILQDNSARTLTFGAVNGLIIPNYQVAVKTGTTNDKRDNWAIGWTPNLLSVVWVGNNDNSPMGKVASGVSGASPIWRRLMLYEVPKRTKQDFPIPEKIVSVDVDIVSGYPAHDGFPSRPDYFIDGTQPNTPDPIHIMAKVCKDSNGLAPPEDVASNNFNTKEFFSFKEDDPVSTDGKNRWQDGINKWLSTQGDQSKYNPPTGYCRSGGLIDLGFDNISDNSVVSPTFDVKAHTTSLVKIVEMKLWVDGQEQKSWSEKPYETTLTLADGIHTLKIKATDRDGNSKEREIKIEVKSPISPTTTVIPTVGETTP